MLEIDASVDVNKIEQLDLERKDHRYLHGLAQRIKGIESHWLALLEKNFAPEVMLQFSHLIHDEARLAESHGFNAVYELMAEIEGTLIAMGRHPDNYTDSIRSYMDSCVGALNKTVNGLIDEALANQKAVNGARVSQIARKHLAPRIYILDTRKDTAAELSVDLKGQGFNVFPLVDWHELERLCRLQKPSAALVVLNAEDESQAFLESLRQLIRIDEGGIPCYVLAREDTPQNRVLAASSGANHYVPLPCFAPALAAELHGLRQVSLAQPMKLMVLGDPKSAPVKETAELFSGSDCQLMQCEKLSQLPFVAPEKAVDGLLLVDSGDEKTLMRSLAIIGQDHYLSELPLTVILRSNYHYNEPLMRLISVAASDVYQSNVDKQLLIMRLESRTLQYRRKHFNEDYLKTIDPESGLMLRRSFYQEVEKRCREQGRNAVPSALLYVRLDYLREITEALGISRIGDLRKQIAHRFVSVLGPDDLVTTLSDNEYLIFASREEAAAYRQIEWSVKKQVEQYGLGVMSDSRLSARVGISLLKDRDVLKTVNSAIGSISIQNGAAAPAAEPATPVLTARHKKESENKNPIAKRLKQAMDEERLTLLFQPIVSMEGDGFERYEVLMRLREGENLLSPTSFLTSDAPANVKRFLDRWVINRALRVMTDSMADRKELKFFIKVCAETIADKSFIDWLGKILSVTDAPIERCVFEVREESVMSNFAEAQAFINFVREQGACVCIENFGSKPQSLKLLDYIEVDYVKLDREYLAAIGSHDERDLRLDSIIDKANKMEVSTLASFVETTSNLSLALQKGVALFQGYFLQPPQESMDFDFSVTT
ncbi:MAG: EAL domain-containing protein [Ketobacteraceae bacterium]|nr:EAL domain-containing protein [Ketobacteraceae bacterium]